MSIYYGPPYPTQGDARAAGDFAREVLDDLWPARFAPWAQEWEHEGPVPGDERVVVRPVPQVGGWVLQASRPGGELMRVSPLYPTLPDADASYRFLKDATAALGRPAPRAGPLQVQVAADCGCRRRDEQCHHYDVTRPIPNPISLSVRPHRAATQGWELVIRGMGGSPLWVSYPYPTKAEGEGARNFALRVVNGRHPLRLEGWNPALPLGAGYVPPPPEQAAATVRVRQPPQASGAWRLQATRPDGSVIVTSLPYRDAPEARESLAFLGVLCMFAGDTTRTGRVRETTQPGDQTCDCRTLGADCHHYEVEGPARRGPEPGYRGPSLGL